MDTRDTRDSVLLVSGSRSLGHAFDARVWAVRHILEHLRAAGPRARVVTGDARGPDTWARAVGIALGMPVDVYRLDGTIEGPEQARRLEPAPPRRWHEGPVPSAKWWPLRRNDAMVAAVAALRDAGARVHVLALHAPWSRTGGTIYTADVARAAGLAVSGYECPADFAPPVRAPRAA